MRWCAYLDNLQRVRPAIWASRPPSGAPTGECLPEFSGLTLQGRKLLRAHKWPLLWINPRRNLRKRQSPASRPLGAAPVTLRLIAGCSERMLHKRFSKIIARARAERRWWLLDQQNAAAEKGNATILIWLGKVELDQVHKKPPPEPGAAYLDAMDAASAEHDRANPGPPESEPR